MSVGVNAGVSSIKILALDNNATAFVNLGQSSLFPYLHKHKIFIPTCLSMSQWQRRFVEPACESFETVPRSMTRAVVKASIVVRHKKLPVQDSKVQQLRGAKLLTRNVSLTIISAIAELVWTRAAPIVLSVHDELFAQCIMLLLLAFMARYNDEVSIRTAVGAVRDLATEVEHLVDQ